MRILIASHDTIPGYSGGWSTPLDLLQDEHEVAYVVKRGLSGSYTLENVPVFGVLKPLRFSKDWFSLNRIRLALASLPFRHAIARAFQAHNADFVLCLNISSARECFSLDLPYALRFHGNPSPTAPGELRKLLDRALFITLGPSVEIPGYDFETINHSVNLDRFEFIEHDRAERVLLLSTLNPLRRPELFIEGVMKSKLSGTIVGDGILRSKVERLCSRTGGKVTYHQPILRLDLPEFLKQFQIGVACFKKVPFIYQMRVNEYMASGIFPLVTPWTHLATEAPEFSRSFETAEDLAQQIDWLAEKWDCTLENRIGARKFVLDNYHVNRPKERMREILAEVFGQA